MSGQSLSPEVINQALATVDTVIAANNAICEADANIKAAERLLQLLQPVDGVVLVEGSMDTLRNLHGQAVASFAVAESMVPNLRQEGLMDHPIFTPNGSTEVTAESVEQAPDLREQLLSTFASGYKTYGDMLDAKNSNLGLPYIIEKISEADVMKKVEAALTPEVLEAVAADTEASDDPRAGFDIEILDGKANTEDQEDAMADALQAEIPHAGKPYKDKNYHNGETAAKAELGDEQIRIRLVPRHANVPSDTVKRQKQGLEAKNAGSKVMWRCPNDEEATAHASILKRKGDLEADDETRFWRTLSRQVESYQEDEDGAPVDRCVPYFCVSADG